MRRLESQKDYLKALKKGCGLGALENYRPWLEVRDVKSRGIRTKVKGILSQRIHHFFSKIEAEFFYTAEFNTSVIDIREQFPLLPQTRSLRIAEGLGLRHPTHPKSKQPTVMTTDFLLTREVNNKIIYEAYAVKPVSELERKRVVEKLTIERIWWESIGVEFKIYVGSNDARLLSQNISWATDIARKGIVFTTDEVNVAISCIENGKHLLKNICDTFCRELGLTSEKSLELFRFLVGERLTLIDLRTEILETGIVEVSDTRSIDEWSMNHAIASK